MLTFYHFSFGIKRQNSKTKSAVGHGNIVKGINEAQARALEDFKKRVEAGFPSVYQITKIAAILTAGNPINHTQPMRVANQAIELWTVCESVRRGKINQIAQTGFFAKKEISELIKQDSIEITPPKKYPVDFDEFLRLTVGGRHKAHRLKIYRDYAKDMVWLGHVFNHQYKNQTAVMTVGEAEKLAAPASLDEVENWIKGTRDLVIEHEGVYFGRARAFLEWRAKQPAERARKAANKRWNKENPK